MSEIVKKYRRNGSIYFLASAQLHELLNTPAHDFTFKEVLVDFGVCYRKSIPPTLQLAIAAFLEIAFKDLTADAFQKLTLSESDWIFIERAIEYARKYLSVETQLFPL